MNLRDPLIPAPMSILACSTLLVLALTARVTFVLPIHAC